MKKIRLCMIALLLVLMAICVMPACKQEENIEDLPQTEITSKIYLNKSEIRLEKYEFEDLVVTVESGDAEKVTWFSNNSEIASVENGRVTAVSAGNVVIGAKLPDGAVAKCFVIVSDNHLIPNIVTNLEEYTNLQIDTYFDLTYAMKYNNKTLEGVEFEFSVSESSVINIENGKITAIKKGSSYLTIKAEWQGVTVEEQFVITVVDNVVGKIFSQKEVELCNDDRKGLPTEILLTPVMYEQNQRVAEEFLQIEELDFNQDILTFDQDENKLIAEKKGQTQVVATLKNTQTGSTVQCGFNVIVSLYEQDKTDSVNLLNLYYDDQSYGLIAKDAFPDLEEEIVLGEKIISVTDVTENIHVGIIYQDGMVDVSGIIKQKILGERIWRVESERYSYIVNILIEEENPSKVIFGEYISNDFEYEIKLEYLNNRNVIKFIDKQTGEIKASGNYSVRDIGKDFGLISATTDNVVYDRNYFNGFYWVYNDCTYIDFNIVNGGSENYENFIMKTSAPYSSVAGLYSSDSWSVKVQLNADGTCVFDVEDKIGKKTAGSYTLKATGTYQGEIAVQLENEFVGQKTVNGIYSINNGRYTVRFTDLSLFESGITMSQKVEKITFNDAISGYYYTKSNVFVPIKLNKDGSCYFAFPDWANTKYILASKGYYVLESTGNQTGTIKIYLDRIYNNNAVIEGEYSVEDGKYVIVSTISGSGNGDVQKFIQKG